MKKLNEGIKTISATALACLVVAATSMTDARADGRLLATGGVTEIEGAAGGGIVPWALIAGYGTRDEVGVTAFYTHLEISDFRLRGAGLAVGLYDRFELSYARQRFGLGSTVPGRSIDQDVFGAKLRLVGDAVFDQDTWLPQVAVGVQFKRNDDFAFIPAALGAKRREGTDVYLAATKLYLAALAGRNVLVDATVRATKANQLGILGFGGDLNDRYRACFEGSAAVFINDQLAIGFELRQKPNNLGAFREQNYKDLFVSYIPNKHVALTAAYARLGQVADKEKQEGAYLSVQLAY